MAKYHCVFVCASCESALFVSAGGTNVCLNQICTKYQPIDGIPVDDIDRDISTVRRELSEIENELVNRLDGWEQDVVSERLSVIRAQIASDFLNKGAIDVDEVNEFHGINKLLLLNRKAARFGGLERGGKEFQLLIELAQKYVKYQNLIEDLVNRRYPVTRVGSKLEPYRLKYDSSIFESLATHGFVGSRSSFDLFTFGPQNEMRPELQIIADLANINDWATKLDNIVEASIMLDRIFRFHHWTSKMYDYKTRAIDMSVVCGWFLDTSEQNPVRKMNIENSKQRWLPHFLQLDSATGYTNFIDQFVENNSLAPVAVRVGSTMHVDRSTALLFLIYLYGRTLAEPPIIGGTGGGSTPNARYLAAQGFRDETVLRLRLSNLCDWVAPHAVQPTKKSKEYDAIAVNESSKTIYFIEAKYQDPAPSSYNGRLLVEQELKGRDGVLQHAVDQGKRLDYFRKNKKVFAAHIKTNDVIENYRAVGIVVTKSTPIIDRHEEVHVLSFQTLITKLETGGI